MQLQRDLPFYSAGGVQAFAAQGAARWGLCLKGAATGTVSMFKID